MLAFAIYIFTDRIPVWADNLLCIGRCCSYWLVYNRLHLFFVGSDRNPVRLNLSQWRLEHMEHYGTLALRGGHEEFFEFHFDPFWVCKVAHKKSFPIQRSCLEFLSLTTTVVALRGCKELIVLVEGVRESGKHLFFPTLTCGGFCF